jgi:GNAT superfamily N-acetyltransferase
LGWRALETQPLGEWLLRASGGFTARANSALAVGDPAIGLPAAVDTVERWYAARGLPPRIQVVAGASPEDLPTVLAARGWASSGTDQVMTAELGHALRAAQAPGVAVQVDEALDAAWLAACRVDAQPLPATAAALLGNHPAAGFASVRADGQCTAIARVAVDGRWAGLFGVEVAEAQRGQGLGSAVSVAALRWATARGARHGYLQVQSGNPVRRLYERWGFEVHHEYAHWEYTHAARASPG